MTQGELDFNILSYTQRKTRLAMAVLQYDLTPKIILKRFIIS